MRIVDIKHYTLENADVPSRTLKLVQVPNLRRIQYTHRALSGGHPARQSFL